MYFLIISRNFNVKIISLNTVNEKLTIFKSLFKGREDIYATRWEKGNKNGYSPAYTFDPYHYKAHRMKGGKQHQKNERDGYRHHQAQAFGGALLVFELATVGNVVALW